MYGSAATSGMSGSAAISGMSGSAAISGMSSSAATSGVLGVSSSSSSFGASGTSCLSGLSNPSMPVQTSAVVADVVDPSIHLTPIVFPTDTDLIIVLGSNKVNSVPRGPLFEALSKIQSKSYRH